MNLGLGNLTELKAHLLNLALRAENTYDDAIAALGKGVAARFEQATNRKFARVVDDTFETSADREHLSLPRYPIEEISAVGFRENMADGFVDQGAIDAIVQNLIESAGIVHLQSPLGGWKDRIRITYTGGYWFPTRGTPAIRRGSVELTAADETIDVAFGVSFGAKPGVVCNIVGPSGSDVISVVPSAVTVAGFTATFGAAIPGSGYSLVWFAVPVSDEAPDATSFLQAVSNLSADAETFTVTFAAAFSVAPAVVCNIIAPADGVVIASVPAAVTTSGFTARFGAPIPASGYKLAWMAQDISATDEEDMPAGATALPADLKFAWLTQCQLVWNAIDALGVGLGSNEARTATTRALSDLRLAPEVEQTLRDHRRYCLT